MRKTREILRLKWHLGRTNREIGISVKASSSTVSECVSRARKTGLSWPLDASLDDATLIGMLYPQQQKVNIKANQLDWQHVHQEMKRKGVTLQLLWHDYKSQHPKGLNYSRYCDLYREWKSQVDVCMRQTHKAGEKMFVDYAGMTIPILVDTATGETVPAQIFVAVLGASNYTYLEATQSQSLPDWIGSHVRAFTYFNGVPEIVVPDNLKSGIKKPHRYEPDINLTYLEMANHYDVAIIPTRVRAPKDKAKVEQAVQHVERTILAKLRNRTFFSVHELNEAIKPLLKALNHAPFQKLPGSRFSQYEALEKSVLKPLPKISYEFATWKKAQLGVDYHVEVDGHYYSAPYRLSKKICEVRLTNQVVEVFFKGKRVASHRRSYLKGRHTTLTEHMPSTHQHYAKWTPDRIIRWAKTHGEFTGLLAEKIIASRKHPQQGFRSCMGLMRLSQSFGTKRLEAACQRAVLIGSHSYKSVQFILKNRLDQLPAQTDLLESTTPQTHEYVRGGDYFK